MKILELRSNMLLLNSQRFVVVRSPSKNRDKHHKSSHSEKSSHGKSNGVHKKHSDHKSHKRSRDDSREHERSSKKAK